MHVYWPIECGLLLILNQTSLHRLYVQVIAMGIIVIISKILRTIQIGALRWITIAKFNLMHVKTGNMRVEV